MKNHIKRALSFILIAIIAITGSGLSAFAVSSGETVYISTTPRAQQNSDTGTDNAYAAGVYWHNGNVSVRFITTRVGSSQTRTDTYVYCIEPGATFVNNTYTANPVSGSTFWNNLSPDAQKVISYATMYGFPVNQFGASKCDAYAATQAIIWEACYGYRTTAGRTNSALYSEMIAGTASQSACVALDQMINNHSKIPSFSSTSVAGANASKNKLNYNNSTGVFSLTINDTNGVLSGYNVVNADGLSVTKSGNSLTISSTSPFDSKTITLERPAPSSNQAFLALDSANNQRCVVGQFSEPVRNYVSFYAEIPCGIIRIHKQNSAPALGDYSLKGAVFEVRDDSGVLVDTIVTDEAGKAQTKEIPLGSYTIREKTAPFGYVVNTDTFNAVLALSGQTIPYADVTIPERPQTGKITVTKLDAATGNIAQGDAALTGTVFEIYKSDKTTVADTIYCGSNTFATSIELPLGTYYVKEKVPPVGYTIDPNFNEVKIEYGGQDVQIVQEKNDNKNKVIQGQIALVKHTDEADSNVSPANEQVEQPLEGAVFEVYLKSAGSYAKAKATERDLLTTNENGYAITKLLPYGIYTVKETSAPGDVKLVQPFDVFISKDGNIYRYILSDPYFRSLVKIVKKDAETGVTIPLAGTSFKVKDLSTGEWVVQHINYPRPIDIEVYETAPDGTLVMPAPLKSGDYELYEVLAPYGYTIGNEPIKFTIHSTPTDPTIVEVIVANTPVKGTISVEKKGNMLTGTTEINTEYGKQFTPVFSEAGLPGAVFDIVAAEDIVTPDDTVRALAGELVDTIMTDENGHAVSKNLYLGNYLVIEDTAPNGFVLDETNHPVSLVYENQDVAVVSSQIGIWNVRQQVEIELQKLMETPVGAVEGFAPAKDVIFGLFADEDILAVDGSMAIAKDRLIALIGVDENGCGWQHFDELPFAKYYMKELRTNAAYELSEVIYPVNVVYAGQDKSCAYFKANGGLDILNSLKYGQLTIEKTGEMLVGSTIIEYDKTNVYQPVYEERKLPGAVFDVIAAEDIYDVYGNIVYNRGDVVDTITTGEDGKATTKPLHLGYYELVETAVPYGVVSNSSTMILLGVDGEITDVISKFVTIHNERQKAELMLTKACEMPENAPGEFNPYASIRFGLYAREDIPAVDGAVAIPAGEMLEIFGVNESGKSIIQTDLPFGKFYVKEMSTALGYVLHESEYEITFIYDGDLEEIINIEINEGQAIENRLIRGNVRLVKTDKESGDKLAGAVFALYDPNGEKIGEYTTNEDGVISVENLPYGAGYKFVEIKAPKGYQLDETPIAFDIAEDGALVELFAENEKIPDKPDSPDSPKIPWLPKTGDDFNAWLWIVISGVSAIALAGIAFVYYRRKRRML